MFNWVTNMPLFTGIFSFRKRSEWKDKQSSEILLEQTKTFSDSKKERLGWMTPMSRNGWAHFFETNLISLLQTNLIV